jgi:hypothetical protein
MPISLRPDFDAMRLRGLARESKVELSAERGDQSDRPRRWWRRVLRRR